MKLGKNNGRGSIGRSIRRIYRLQNELGYKIKCSKSLKKSQLKRKLRINNRCIDCNKLISPQAKRCDPCSRKVKVLRIKY
jgi:rRNA maturation endonuclease Nob1